MAQTKMQVGFIESLTASIAELNYLDITTLGTAQISKALVLDGSKNITSMGTISSGIITSTGLDINGSVDISGDLTLSAGADGALRFSAASSVKILDDSGVSLVFEEADTPYMTFVTTNGSEAIKFDKALDINAAIQSDSTITVGVDGTGYDVKFFGATASAYMLWDEDVDDLILSGAAQIVIPEGQLVLGSTAMTSTATELNLLDNVTNLVKADFTKLAAVDSTAAELNIIDGNTSATSTVILDPDRLVLNDNGTMVQVAVTDLKTYIGAGTDWQTVKTSAFDAYVGEGYAVNTNSGAITCTLPDAASAGDTIEFIDYSRNFAVNNLTLDQNGVNFQGRTTPNPVYDVAGQSIRLVYVDSTQGWIPTSDDDVTLETITPPYTVEYLVIAGGGSGGVGASSGGGGAGGYRNSYGSETSGGGGGSETGFTAVTSTVYTVVIGAGGTAQSGSGGQGTSSSIAGTSVSISTVGGGDGGDRSNTSGPSGRDGADGGSGGGGGTTTGDATTTDGGDGTDNQGYDGGTGQHTSGSHEGAGGGGGAGVAGQAGYKIVGSSGQGGAGGNGLASSITGASVTRAGGGGGRGNYNGSGGSGGGGAGTGTVGQVNTGSGGGGGSAGGGHGGSGVVILRMATSNYSGTYSGTATVDSNTVSGQTIIIFTNNGTYTG